MNAFEDIIKLILEEEGYWVRQSVKIRKITIDDKKRLHNNSMPTPEVDVVALKTDKNELLLMEVKSFLDSPGVKFEGVSGKNKKDAKRYKIFTNESLRKIITERLKQEYLEKGLINKDTTISYALAAGHVYSTKKNNDELDIRKYFKEKGWKFISPMEIKDGIKKLGKKGWEDNLVTITAKLTKEESR